MQVDKDETRFPASWEVHPTDPNVALRDWFAGMAMIAFGSMDSHPDCKYESDLDLDLRTMHCYELAVAMMKARESSERTQE